MCVNLKVHSKMKHVRIYFHFVQDRIIDGPVRVSHISCGDQLVDAFTKPQADTNFNLYAPILVFLIDPES